MSNDLLNEVSHKTGQDFHSIAEDAAADRLRRTDAVVQVTGHDPQQHADNYAYGQPRKPVNQPQALLKASI